MTPKSNKLNCEEKCCQPSTFWDYIPVVAFFLTILGAFILGIMAIGDIQFNQMVEVKEVEKIVYRDALQKSSDWEKIKAGDIISHKWNDGTNGYSPVIDIQTIKGEKWIGFISYFWADTIEEAATTTKKADLYVPLSDYSGSASSTLISR